MGRSTFFWISHSVVLLKMQILWMTILVISGSILSGIVSAAPMLTLETARSRAVGRSEVVKDFELQAEQSVARAQQARGAMLPTVQAVGSYQVQEAIQTSTTGSSIFPTSQPLAKLQLSQPLFRGLRDWALVRQNTHQEESLALQKEKARRQVSQDVLSAYMLCFGFEQDLEILKHQKHWVEERLQSIERRVRIGSSKKSEALAAQVTLSTLEAQISKIEQDLELGWKQLSFLTGENERVTLEKPKPLSPEPPQAENMRRVSERPEWKSQTHEALAASEAVSVAKGAHLPSADLTANYYFLRAGLLSSVHWDVSASLSFPLYQGGVVDAKVREAQLSQVRQETALSKVGRELELELRRAYAELEQARSQVRLLKVSKKTSDAWIQEQHKEFKQGLLTDLEWLQAQIQDSELGRTVAKAERLELEKRYRLEWMQP